MMNINTDLIGPLGWTHIWQVTIVASLVAVAVRLGCRHRPHLAYLLWMLVVVKCLTPPIVTSPTGVFSWAQAEFIHRSTVSEAVTEGTVVLADTSPILDSDVGEPLESTPTRTKRKTSAPKTATPLPATSAPPSAPKQPFGWTWILFAVWATGVGVGLSVAVIKRVACSIVMRRYCRAADADLDLAAQRMAKKTGIRGRVNTLVTEKPLGPAVIGLLRPTVLLPSAIVNSCSLKQIEPILAHELIHFRRGDTRIGLLQLVAQVLWWFHPLVWWANRQASRERERCCDEEAIALLDCEPHVYAQTLIDVLRQKRQLQPLFAVPGMRTVEITTRRIEHIMRRENSFRPRTPIWCWGILIMAAAVLLPGGGLIFESRRSANGEPRTGEATGDPVAAPQNPKPGEHPQWGHTPHRNNVAEGEDIPSQWDFKTGQNIRWKANLGSATYNSPVVAGGKVFIGTNNQSAYLKRFPAHVDLACLLCFDQTTGEFLWQYSSEKLPTGRIHDWPGLGLCSVPYVSGDRLWVVTNRCEVICLDTQGFRDGENDGPVKNEASDADDEADVVWKFDMLNVLGVRPHNQSCSSITCAGDVLLLGTSNGVNESHLNLDAPDAPSFIALHRDSGKLLWQDDSPGENILHGQWSSPAYGVLDGVPQAIFAGGDGYLYSFDVRDIKKGRTNLLWWFDGNPKTSKWILGGRGTRNNIVATPVIYDGLVYVAMGQDIEHGEGNGHLWCVDPTKRGDISGELVFNESDPKTLIPHKRLQACEPDKGDFTRKNPNSGVVWHYDKADQDMDGTIGFEETMHRAWSSVAISNDLLYISDTSGLFHCVDAKTGQVHWTHDLFASGTGSPLVVDGKVYVGDEDGEVAVFKLSKKKTLLGEVSLDTAMYGTPVSAGNVLYLATQGKLFAVKSTNGATEKAAADKEMKTARGGTRKPSTTAAWPSFRGGSQNQGVAAGELPKHPRVLWKTDSGANGIESTPVIVGDKIIVCDLDGRVTALNKSTGVPQWRMETKSSFEGSPAVRDGRVYVGDTDGFIYCLKAATGELLWKVQTDGEIKAGANVFGDRVLVGSATGTLFCLDAKSGKVRWQYSTGDQIRSTPMITGNLVCVAGCDSQLHLVDLNNGQGIGRVDLKAPTMGTPAVVNSRLYVGNESGMMFAIDLAESKVAWQSELDGKEKSLRSSAAVIGNLAFIGSRGKKFYAVDTSTGEVVREFLAKAGIDSSPVIAGRRVFFGANDGRIYGLDIRTFEKVFEFEAAGRFIGSPAIAGHIMVIASDRGVVYCFGTAKPE